MKPDKISWVQDSRFDLDAGTQAIAIRPDNYADRFQAGADASRHGGRAAARAATSPAQVKIRLPLVGGKVERAIVDGLVEHLDAGSESRRRAPGLIPPGSAEERRRRSPVRGEPERSDRGHQTRWSTKRSSWRRLRHSNVPSQWVPYSPTMESPVSQYDFGSGFSQ